MRAKYKFKTQPLPGQYGTWTTEDGFKCYTDDRAAAVRWYKRWLDENKNRTQF